MIRLGIFSLMILFLYYNDLDLFFYVWKNRILTIKDLLIFKPKFGTELLSMIHTYLFVLMNFIIHKRMASNEEIVIFYMVIFTINYLWIYYHSDIIFNKYKRARELRLI